MLSVWNLQALELKRTLAVTVLYHPSTQGPWVPGGSAFNQKIQLNVQTLFLRTHTLALKLL